MNVSTLIASLENLKSVTWLCLTLFFFFLCKSLDKHIERAPVMGGFSGMVKTKPPYQHIFLAQGLADPEISGM